jgi:PAS domain S-box-containing protein
LDFGSGEDLDRILSSLEVNEEEDFASRIINSTMDGILAYDRQCRYTLFNPAMERLTGLPREKVLGRVAWEVFPMLKELGHDRYFHAALRGETLVGSEDVYDIPPTGKRGHVHRCHMPLRNEMGEIVGGLAVIRDVSERVRTMNELRRLNETLEHRVRERTRELESAVGSLKFLADAGVALSASLERDGIVRTLGELATRYFDGWCIVRLSGGGELEFPRVHHREPELVSQFLEIERRFPPRSDTLAGPYGVLRTGKPQWTPQVFEANMEDLARTPEHLRLLHDLRVKSYICAPLTGHERVWGAVSFISQNRMYTPGDLQVATDLAARAGVAVENAHLFAEARRVRKELDQARGQSFRT